MCVGSADAPPPPCAPLRRWDEAVYDLNAWQGEGRSFSGGGGAESAADPPRPRAKHPSALMSGPDAFVPLDSVGGCTTLVRADVHREGGLFPTYYAVGATWGNQGLDGALSEGAAGSAGHDGIESEGAAAARAQRHAWLVVAGPRAPPCLCARGAPSPRPPPQASATSRARWGAPAGSRRASSPTTRATGREAAAACAGGGGGREPCVPHGAARQHAPACLPKSIELSGAQGVCTPSPPASICLCMYAQPRFVNAPLPFDQCE